jgi:hypothetical protein
MKNLTLILIAAFGLNSCVKKEEEVVVPYTCQNCVEIYEIQRLSYTLDTVYSSRIDTIKFEYCGTYEYMNSIGGESTPIHAFDSLGNYYVKGFTRKTLIYWHCEFKPGYEIIQL